MSNAVRQASEKYAKEEMERKLYRVATYVHDIWYIYKDDAKKNGKKPTADGFFDWLEGYIL